MANGRRAVRKFVNIFMISEHSSQLKISTEMALSANKKH